MKGKLTKVLAVLGMWLMLGATAFGAQAQQYRQELLNINNEMAMVQQTVNQQNVPEFAGRMVPLFQRIKTLQPPPELQQLHMQLADSADAWIEGFQIQLQMAQMMQNPNPNSFQQAQGFYQRMQQLQPRMQQLGMTYQTIMGGGQQQQNQWPQQQQSQWPQQQQSQWPQQQQSQWPQQQQNPWGQQQQQQNPWGQQQQNPWQQTTQPGY
jgi:hypothetical protein